MYYVEAMVALVLADHFKKRRKFKIKGINMKIKIMVIKIPIKSNFKDKDIQNYFKICKEKLGLIPNILNQYY